MARKMLQIFLLLLLVPLSALAEGIGWIIAIDGTANIFHEEVWQPTAINSPVTSQDSVRSDPETKLLLYLVPNAVLVLDTETEVTLEEKTEDAGTVRVLRLLSGRVRILARSGDSLAVPYQIETGVAVVRVEYGDIVITDLNEVLVLEGEVAVWKRGLDQEKQALQAGSTVTLAFARAIEQFPLKDLMREELMASLWTLNYPSSPTPETTLSTVPKLKGRASKQATHPPLIDSKLINEPIAQRLETLFLQPADPRLFDILNLIK